MLPMPCQQQKEALLEIPSGPDCHKRHLRALLQRGHTIVEGSKDEAFAPVRSVVVHVSRPGSRARLPREVDPRER